MAEEVEVGIIGGGLMGREVAAALARWLALYDHPVRPRLTGVCDTDPATLEWFDRIDTVRLKATDHRELMEDDRVEVLYIAVPHHLHEELYLDATSAGKDFLGEKPFGIRPARRRADRRGAPEPARAFRAVFQRDALLPGRAAPETIRSGSVGRILEAHSAFLHSSDLDVTKAINWKRQARFCGRLGVMGDLGMHVLHVPLRLGGVRPGYTRCSRTS